MIKLTDLLKESYAWERKFGEPLPTLASVQKKKLKEEINKLTEKLSKSEIKKMRDKFNKTGKLPPHLKKLADLMDKYKDLANCGRQAKNIRDTKAEINRRFGMPIFIPLIALISCFLLRSKKEGRIYGLY